MQLVVAIDPNDTRTLQTQVFEEMKRMILDGRLQSGDPVPGSRTLSEQLGVSRNTIIFAYDKLLCEGYIESRANIGTFVSANLPDKSLHASSISLPRVNRIELQQSHQVRFEIQAPVVQHVLPPFKQRMNSDFWIGRVEPKAFPTREWRSIIDAKIRHGSARISAYGDPQGVLELREAVADHIGPARGIVADTESILITCGSQDGLSLIAHAFAGERDNFLHEDPCYQGARFAFKCLGYNSIAVPIDEHGIEVDRLPESRRSLLYITPSHQYPIGVTMTLQRRRRLLEWAERTDSLIIEDDYDGEFRYEGAPLTALRGLDGAGRVLYLGTFSKSFGPGLRLGFIIASPEAIRILCNWKQLLSNGSPWLEQAAMAEFMKVGGFRRHLRRIRIIYMHRRDTLLVELQRHFPGCQTFGHHAGMHLSWCLPDPKADAGRLEKMAALQRIGIYRPETGGAWISSDNLRHRNHLLMGYAAVDEKLIQIAVARLADSMSG